MQTNSNGSRQKLDPELNQELRAWLLKDQPFTGEDNYGKYYLHSVQNVETGEEPAFFAPPQVHELIVAKVLGKRSEVIVMKVPFQNGKKITSKLDLTVISAPAPAAEPVRTGAEDRKQPTIQSMKDPAEVVAAVPEPGFRAEDARAIGLSIYISRTKQGGEEIRSPVRNGGALLFQSRERGSAALCSLPSKQNRAGMMQWGWHHPARSPITTVNKNRATSNTQTVSFGSSACQAALKFSLVQTGRRASL